MNSLDIFLAQMALNCFVLCLGLYLWKILWADNYASNIPKGHYTAEGVNFYMDRKEFFKAESFGDVVHVMYKVLRDFNASYWIENVGFDGYSYLYLQRKCLGFLMTIIVMGLFLLAFEFSMRAANLNPYYYYFVESIFMPYKYSVFLFIVSALFINELIFIRKHLQTEYINLIFDKNKYRGLDWMKLRTIHVEGMLFDDLSGAKLRHKINAALEEKGIESKVDQLLVIPAYARLLALEVELRELEYGQQVLQGTDPLIKRIFLRMCLPKKYKDKLTFESKRDSLQKEMDKEALMRFQGSGHAILCFESIAAAQFCLSKYNPNKEIWQIIAESVKQMCQRCFSSSRPLSRSRVGSADSDELANYEDFSITCQEVPDPNDIAWVNLEGEIRGIYIWRCLLVNVFLLFALIFFSTPAAIFAFVQKYFQIDFFSFKWTDRLPKPFGPLLNIYLPALSIVLLNQVVIFFIDILTYYERFQRHSVFQISIFRKYYLYLIINVIIVPAFIMAQQDSIFEIITMKVTINLRESFNRLYTEDHGMVFATIITQSAAISVFLYLNRIGDLFVNYFSTKLTYHRRIFQNDEQSYLREGTEVFQYGYFYSQLLIMLSIVFQFMLSSSWILFAGVCYFFLRQCLDGYLLLAVHTREMDSSGCMVNTSLQFAMIGLILFQVQFFVGFFLKNDIYQMIISGVLIFFSLVITIFSLRKPLFEIGLMQDKSIDFNRYNKSTIQSLWRSFYKHPLTVSSVASQSISAAATQRLASSGFKLKSQKRSDNQSSNRNHHGGGNTQPQQQRQQSQSQQSGQQVQHYYSKLAGGSEERNRGSHSLRHHVSSKEKEKEKEKHDGQSGSGITMKQSTNFQSSTSISQNKSRFSNVRNLGFATDTDN